MTIQTRTLKHISLGVLLFAGGWFANLFFNDHVLNNRKAQYRIMADTIANQMNVVSQALITSLKHDRKLDSYFNWKAKNTDTTNYRCEIRMENEYLIHWFKQECAYYFFTHVTSDTTVDMLWSHKSDCKGSMDFLEKPNGETAVPKKGDLFATYTMTNDTTLQAKYYFPKWTKRVNEIAKDSLFAMYYYMTER